MSWKQDFQEFQVFQKFQEIPRPSSFHILWKQGFRETMGQLTSVVAGCCLYDDKLQVSDQGLYIKKRFPDF